MWRIALGTYIAFVNVLMLVLWSRRLVPTYLLLSVWLLSIIVGIYLVSKTKLFYTIYKEFWTIKGAALWFMLVVVSLSIYVILRHITKAEIRKEHLYSAFVGYIGAYVISFVVYKIYTLVSRRH